MMQTNMYIVFFIVCCIVQSIDSSLIGCQNEKNEVLISNFNGYGEHNSNIFCKGNVVIRTYSKCHVNYIKLPIEEIAKMFPSVRIVNWACTGECRIDLANVNIAVKGCLSGTFLFVCC